MPKTFKRLYPSIYAFENLYLAFRKARKGGKRKKERVAAFELDLEANLWRLHGRTRHGELQPQVPVRLRRFWRRRAKYAETPAPGSTPRANPGAGHQGHLEE